MKYNQYEVTARVWLYPGPAGWHFVTIPPDISDEIKSRFGDRAKGWGSLPVLVTIGKTSWKTSIFPDKKEEGYLLPLKAAMRKKVEITAGDTIRFIVEIAVS